MRIFAIWICGIYYLSCFIMDVTGEVPKPLNGFSIKQAIAGDKQVVLVWDSIAEAAGYIIEYGSNSKVNTKLVDGETTSYTITDLENGATYSFKISCVSKTRGQLKVTPTISVRLPQWSGLVASQLGLLVNDNDPYSVSVAEYYQKRRLIPLENIVHLNISKVIQLTPAQFAPLKAKVEASLSSNVQAIAIAWTIPNRVGCNSITSAFTLGYMGGPCINGTCGWANSSPIYFSNTRQPFTDFKIRPSMMLAAYNVEQAKALIDRGIAADGTNPHGVAYIMNTTDSIRSLRAIAFPPQNLGTKLSPYVDAQILKANSIVGKTDALFYFQGLAHVQNIATNKFPAGAIADHLTSFGGGLTNSSQMSALEFIAGGATGTFGTVSEPCAYAQKFPLPSFVIKFYTNGETLIEAYWKSVVQTFQGLFIGEPLANPWRKQI